MKNVYEEAPNLKFHSSHGVHPMGCCTIPQQSLSNQCCKEKPVHLVVKRQILLTPLWHEEGGCQVKVAGRIPRDRAWATGWTEDSWHLIVSLSCGCWAHWLTCRIKVKFTAVRETIQMAVTLFSPSVFSRDNHLNLADLLPAALTPPPSPGRWLEYVS